MYSRLSSLSAIIETCDLINSALGIFEAREISFPVRSGLEETHMSQKRADFLIVGAGSAGCVLANRLSADPMNHVILLEAGGRDINPWIHVPVGYFKTLHIPNTDWCYKSEPEPGLNGRSLDWPRG
jgi:hypothetical protein